MKALCLPCLTLLLALFAGPAAAQIGPVASPTGPVMAGPYLAVDAATGETLVQRDAGAAWYPASLTKLMTMYIVFEEMKAGRLQPGDPVVMSRHALSTEYAGFLGVPAGGTITVDTALTALVVRSLNDVAVALGEKVSGSEPAFAQRMNETAKRLGMTATHYVNAHGLPNPGQVTTARDLAVLALALARDFPQYYGYFHADRLDFGARHVVGGVKFVEMYAPYAEGLKTGFICASGFNIVGSATRDGRRLIAVALGFRRADLRDEFLVRLFDQAFALKTAGSRPKVWQLRNEPSTPGNVLPQGECGMIRYDMPGDAAWLGTYGDWKTARRVYDTGEADLVTLGVTQIGKEYILPVTVNKVTRQAAIIADLTPDAAQKLCASYKARKQFCEVKKPTDFSAPFSGFWR
ncbi:MAG: D-alanyl-D-alanine carboxypeptidase [Proteobacteria bacterium]|nr:D-alanyl-D-alanine carboxypeptidase [Pseudomonadota bacterium]